MYTRFQTEDDRINPRTRRESESWSIDGYIKNNPKDYSNYFIDSEYIYNNYSKKYNSNKKILSEKKFKSFGIEDFKRLSSIEQLRIIYENNISLDNIERNINTLHINKSHEKINYISLRQIKKKVLPEYSAYNSHNNEKLVILPISVTLPVFKKYLNQQLNEIDEQLIESNPRLWSILEKNQSFFMRAIDFACNFHQDIDSDMESRKQSNILLKIDEIKDDIHSCESNINIKRYCEHLTSVLDFLKVCITCYIPIVWLKEPLCHNCMIEITLRKKYYMNYSLLRLIYILIAGGEFIDFPDVPTNQQGSTKLIFNIHGGFVIDDYNITNIEGTHYEEMITKRPEIKDNFISSNRLWIYFSPEDSSKLLNVDNKVRIKTSVASRIWATDKHFSLLLYAIPFFSPVAIVLILLGYIPISNSTLAIFLTLISISITEAWHARMEKNIMYQYQIIFVYVISSIIAFLAYGIDKLIFYILGQI